MTRPTHLLVILSDQHNPRVAGYAGHPLVQTPNLDRLAARGTRFRSAYTNCPICVPARASFATGRYVHRTRFWDNAIAYDGSIPSWGHRLMAQGHRVTSIGKLHYTRSEPRRNGFDEEILPMHIADGLGDLAGLIRDEMLVRTGDRKMARESGPGETAYSQYDRDIADAACRWIETRGCEQHAKPWVLYVGFVRPHPPFIAPQAYFDRYRDVEIAMPDRYEDAAQPRHPHVDAMRRLRPYNEGFNGPEDVRRVIRSYYALVSFLDFNVGRVLDALANAGLADTTRVIYGSDHGENLGTRGLWGKSTLYEESAGIPLLMAGPDIAPGRVVDTPVSLVDAFPTVLDAVGADPHAEDRDLPGTSLIAIANGAVPRRNVLSEYHASASISGSFMIRHGRYKYIHYTGFRPMLFDLEADPYERDDLAGRSDYARDETECAAALRRMLDPDAVERQVRADQDAMIERVGGKDKIKRRGSIHHTPPPGVATTLTPVESARDT